MGCSLTCTRNPFSGLLLSLTNAYFCSKLLSHTECLAQKLGPVLMLPSELIPGEICGFFANTLKRHGNGERPDLGDYSSFES
jgi:hypothetical protein